MMLAACQAGCQASTAIGIPLTTTFPTETATQTSAALLPTETPPAIPATETPTLVPTIPPSMVELEEAEIPEGFSLIKFAEIPNPTAFAFDPQGRLYVTSLDGRVYLLHDENEDGRSDWQVVFSETYQRPLGVAVHEPTGNVYVSHSGTITRLKDMDRDNKAEDGGDLVRGLPEGLHQNDGLEFGPDGFLYMGIGSTCDACSEPDPRSATIMRFNVTTGEGEIFATGLRNPYDIAFHHGSGDLFATDNGRDDLGLNAPFEELNYIMEGGDYGWPDCWNEQDVLGCEDTTPAVAFFEAGSSANGVDFYNGERFPTEYRGNAFVSIFGSSRKVTQTGIQRVILTTNGNTYAGQADWFIKFPQGVKPLPVLSGPDDALYVGDFVAGVIYRISYGVP
jgi:glucose/arabinose dehydrogenase